MTRLSNKKTIQQITLAGLLMALAIGFSFASFPLLGGRVYLVGIIIFLMPLVLRFSFALISGILAVILADLIAGSIIYVWISLIAYGGAILIISLFSLIKNKYVFIWSLTIASLWIIITYFLLELVAIDKALAISDLIATSIEFLIVIPFTTFLYIPLRIVLKNSK